MSTHKSKSKRRSREPEIALLGRISASIDTYMAGRGATASGTTSIAPPPPSALSSSSPPCLASGNSYREEEEETTTSTTKAADGGGSGGEDDVVVGSPFASTTAASAASAAPLPPSSSEDDPSTRDDAPVGGTSDGVVEPSASSSSDVDASGDAVTRDLLATRALVRSIARACASEGVSTATTEGGGVEGEGEDEKSFIDALVGEYRDRYPSLSGGMILDGIARHVGGGDDDAASSSARPNENDDDDADDDGGRRRSKLERIVASVESHMREYEDKVEAIRITRTFGEAAAAMGAPSPGHVGGGAGGGGGGGDDAAPKSKRSRGGEQSGSGKQEKKSGEEGVGGEGGGDAAPTLKRPRGRPRGVKRKTEEEEGAGGEGSGDGDDGGAAPKLKRPRGRPRSVKRKMVEEEGAGGKGGGDGDGDDDGATPKMKRSRGKPSGGKKGTKNDEENRLFEEIARRYATERDALRRLPNGHLESIVDEAKKELGLEHVEVGTMAKLDKRVRWLYNRHRDQEGAPNQQMMIVEEIYARYSRTKIVVNGGKLRPGTLASIIEGVRLEHGFLPDPRRMRAIRNMVQARFTKEHPELEPANPNRLKIGELAAEDKRRREALVNEITARYVRTKAAHGKRKMADGTLSRIIEECKNDLGIHDFDVPAASIRGRINRKSLHVQKLGGGSQRYDAIDAPLVATINSWSGEGISVTRDQGLDLANRLLRGKRMEKDDDGNDVMLDAQWWKTFLHRNKKKLFKNTIPAPAGSGNTAVEDFPAPEQEKACLQV